MEARPSRDVFNDGHEIIPIRVQAEPVRLKPKSHRDVTRQCTALSGTSYDRAYRKFVLSEFHAGVSQEDLDVPLRTFLRVAAGVRFGPE
jgi:hypothetical protein